jgi:predicted MPP superfamily phosphohydrolase
MNDVRNPPAGAKSLSDSPSEQARPKRRGRWLQLRNPVGFEWNRLRLPIAGLPLALAGLRILHLTDFHFGQWSRAYDELIERVRANEPDLLLIGGDYVESKRDPWPAVPLVRRLLEQLTARFGCFGVLGNHDGPIGPNIVSSNFTLIDRQRKLLEINGAKLELIGIPRLTRQGPDQAFIDSLPTKTVGVPRVVLSHFSDFVNRMRSSGVDLFLAGHTHGGQICLPGGLAMVKHTSLPRRYVRGVHRIENMWFVANRGMGYSTIRIRTFCPSEVVEIELVRG